ncbi:MAG: endopeptidase La [Ignavibacteria bacterium CG_4_8_14_3_um_filter_37_9]|nr:endopeptidase La [Ignavibacteria bacterium]PIP76336.1 MAG: endopeptidase La [Ignavibacteria bacterium CG22_combo_CG10-13_8_21_14_all_37_15]PIS44094.1 MAG: endopeptidase La [Ignavibacteria bacterium CG08_land_8_20_14_0_20_37_9]PIW99831.1 MAG: endopeptidase La [Ignavibacteria bacterium CG_4_8_14_3_um_filter_37_9]PIX92959.1 MAG: endopeptidase La [Ignavibacteria bacterium CG_4_10_14_3_um_filter_37_18]PJC60664.1 MAG: endopeptidase La [Ignavibacteria bacterium CG_4_9_14_0_2_um_filter_37_13]
MIFPVLVGREQSIRAANAAVDRDKFIFLSSQKKSNLEDPQKEDIYQEGTIARIVQILKLPNGLMKILVDGLLQGRIIEFTGNKDFFEARIEVIIPKIENDHEMKALVRQMTGLFKEYVKINRNIPSEAINAFEAIEEPDRKLFYAAANINQSLEVKQKILVQTEIKDQFYEVIKLLNSEIDILKIEKEIDGKVQENIGKTQRKFIIQEQIKILQDELGEDGEFNSEINKLRDKIKKAKMSKLANDAAIEELNKLQKIPPMSPEFTVIRNYLDWLIDVPWYKKSEDHLDIKHVENILNEDHFGLEKPKERIIEHIAVLNLVKQMRGQILCLVGPPGVGKTSLGKSIARAIGREFIRISLGGVRDEAEIRGHRKTYIGSMPGKIIHAMKRAGTINPLILLDEIDKLSTDFRGDPSSAMLEVLDPEQNHTFQDHYLEVDYDLSQVMFITTANIRYSIPLPLQDRMEIIELPSYLEYDKLEIAKRHLLPKQIIAHGLQDKNVQISEQAIKKVISGYTRESGVRNLERELASLCRKSAKEIVLRNSGNGAKEKKSKPLLIDEKKVEEFLGIPRFKRQTVQKENRVGSTTGLAWTSVGGEILEVDVTIMPGQEKLSLTGQLGNVMKESAQAGLSYIRSNTKKLGIPEQFFKGKEIHIHLPEGAIPKDGPSAGITMVMAMLSAISGKPTSSDVAMTGEITLRGKVLPIGGLNEKLIAAKRSNIPTILIPKDNEIDLKEILPKVKDGLTIIPIGRIEDALPFVFKKTIVKRKLPVVKKKAIAKKKK